MRTPATTRLKTGPQLPVSDAHNLTYRQIYKAINDQEDFNGSQLFFLSRLVDRKLKAFDPRISVDELENKPYRG